jgi:sugar phosphate isomerase/epimerase
MLLGAMNHPMRDPIEEIRAFAAAGFDFVDLTLEPDRAYAATLDVKAVRDALHQTGLGVVGHTAWYLPLASPFPILRRAALDELSRDLDVFAALDVDRMNVHPDRGRSLSPTDWIVERNAEALATLATKASHLGIRVIVENIPGLFGRVDVLQTIFERVPALGFHLDVAHANLGVVRNATSELLDAFGDRLVHVHFSDNKGGDADLHLPLGAGYIDWSEMVKLVKSRGYDGTITLEVFSDDAEYLHYSARKIRALWAQQP